jgi:hypothetical protein
VAKFLEDCLNHTTLPDYLNKGRITLLSKSKSSSVVTVDETRPIVINSHLKKICEKAILHRL